MSEWRTCYWRFFNIAGRFVGAWFVVGGGICFYYALSQGDVLAIVMTAIFVVLGILMIIAKPYRPDLRDSDSQKPADGQTKTK